MEWTKEQEAKWRDILDAKPLETVEEEFARGAYSIPKSTIPPNFVRIYIDRKRLERPPAQGRHKKATLYLTAFVAILVIAGFLL